MGVPFGHCARVPGPVGIAEPIDAPALVVVLDLHGTQCGGKLEDALVGRLKRVEGVVGQNVAVPGTDC